MSLTENNLNNHKSTVLNDYRIAYQSRQASYLGRKEVLTGKAKFGIFGDGKELPQLAMAKFFKPGDFRSGYYRDQTFMMATGLLTVRQFFAQLYATPDVIAEPASAGRMMTSHFGTRLLDEKGNWKELKNMLNSSSDISPTAAQMPRLVGLAFASKYYRQNADIIGENSFSVNGNEVAWGTIGNASTSEGHFFESINAGGVLKIPMVVSVWDDGYGISVPAKYQTTKGSISEILKGFEIDEKGQGYKMFVVKGWDYLELLKVYEEASRTARENHTPCLIHVKELTQPQGHSTSGSHERYKTKERLEWEAETDCLTRFRKWIISTGIAQENEIVEIETTSLKYVKEEQKGAWNDLINPIKEKITELRNLLLELAKASSSADKINAIIKELDMVSPPLRRDVAVALSAAIRVVYYEENPLKKTLFDFKENFDSENLERFSSNFMSISSGSALNIKAVKAVFDDNAELVDGRQVLQACFDNILEKDPRVLAFGEDVGHIGDVNRGMAGLQEKYGESRVFDTGIRELTIIGQGIGCALRGLRPIAEIQYLDYLLYGLQPLCDDVSTLQYRTKGGQKAPIIVRTRGHRLEGIWHSGSPMAMVINALRGMHVCVPRNMTQAAGFYNTLLKCDEPAVVVECLNGYRLKEKMPTNVTEMMVPLGVPEILNEGTDVTLVTYGSCVQIAIDAVKQLKEFNISVELIDVQTLLPFDISHMISDSVKKTNKVVFLDEDVPGGATSYMMQKVLEGQDALKYLDAKPVTIASKEHRPAYGSDGGYFTIPNAEDVFFSILKLMQEYNPLKY